MNHYKVTRQQPEQFSVQGNIYRTLTISEIVYAASNEHAIALTREAYPNASFVKATLIKVEAEA